MKLSRKLRGLFILMVLFFCGICHSPIGNAAMEPAEIERIKEKSLVQLTGKVIDDKLIEQPEDASYPYQKRRMTIEIIEVVKSSAELKLDRTIEVEYIYIPSWVQMEGGAKMDIAISDKIEIWLDKVDNVWHSASSGDTVEHIFYSELHKDHIREPIIRTFTIATIPPIAIVTVSLTTLFILVWFLMRLVKR